MNFFNYLVAGINTIYENTDGCGEHYICATSLYLLSKLSQSFNNIIDRGISAQVHGREVVYGLNAKDKIFIFHMMTNVQLSGS